MTWVQRPMFNKLGVSQSPFQKNKKKKNQFKIYYVTLQGNHKQDVILVLRMCTRARIDVINKDNVCVCVKRVFVENINTSFDVLDNVCDPQKFHFFFFF